MNTTVARILIVDDDTALAERLKDSLQKHIVPKPEIDVFDDFDSAEAALQSRRFDLALLDVLDGSSQDGTEAGRATFERIRESQWLPIVFCTAQPVIVEDLQGPFVRVVNKRSTREIPGIVETLLDSGVPQFTRRIANDVDLLVRAFVRDHVAANWDAMSEAERDEVLPHVANRLSHFIRSEYLDEIHSRRDGDEAPHPSAARFWLHPPVTRHLTTGDLFRRGGEWWVLATPECDLELRGNGAFKAEYLRMIRCVPVDEVQGGRKFVTAENMSKTLENGVKDLVGDHARFFYCPAFLTIPHLLADFESVTAFPKSEVLGAAACVSAEAGEGSGEPEVVEAAVQDAVVWERLATIDAPYRQALLYRLSRATSRIGIEDFPVEPVVEYLQRRRQARMDAAR